MKLLRCFFPIILLFFLLLTPSAAFSYLEPNQLPATPPYIPGEVIVQYKRGQSPNDLQKEISRRQTIANTPIIGGLRIAAENLALQQQGKQTPEAALDTINRIQEDTGTMETRSLLPTTQTQESDTYLIKTDQQEPVAETLQQFRSLAQVAYAEPNYILHTASVTPNDPHYSIMWNLAKIQTDNAWDISKGSNSVIAAVIDSGIDYTHQDLPAHIIKGKNYMPCIVMNRYTGSCEQSDPSCTQTANGYCSNDPMDNNGHGTHVAGTIGALTNNNLGVASLNWQTQLLAIKVADRDGALTYASSYQAIREAADKGAKVINLSLGLSVPCSQTTAMQDAIDYARSKGASIVVAAMNNNTDASSISPASCNGVITVGATGPNDQRAYYSDYGNVVTIAAPGGGGGTDSSCSGSYTSCVSTLILSTWPEGLSELGAITDPTQRYALMQGTSMAAPHVSGTIALMLAVNPNLTADQVKNMLISSADPITTDRPIGPRLNVYRAVLAAQQSLGSNPTNTPASTATTAPLQGDINHDGLINLLDFTIWKCEFLGSGTCNNPVSHKSADVNGDGIVNLLDFSLWRSSYHP